MGGGKFICLDGVDGAGKSTQCRLLVEALRRLTPDVVECADPGGTAVGNELRKLLLGHRHELSMECEALLFMASRAQLVSQIIRPALDADYVVVCDRFLLANVVYQGHAGGLDVDRLWQVGLLATAGLLPDMTFVLDMPIEEARHRLTGPPDRLENRESAFHQRVRDGFLAEARKTPDRIRIVDATQRVDVVQQNIWEEVRRVLESGSRS